MRTVPRATPERCLKNEYDVIIVYFASTGTFNLCDKATALIYFGCEFVLFQRKQDASMLTSKFLSMVCISSYRYTVKRRNSLMKHRRQKTGL